MFYTHIVLFGHDMTGHKKIVKRIREKVLALAEVNDELFHPKDVERVRDNRWAVERFVLDSATEDKAFKALFDALLWRKSFGVNDFDDHYFPEEFYRIVDKEGRSIVWMKAIPRPYEHDQILAPLRPLYHKFLIHNIDRIDRQCTDQGWAVIVDMSDLGLFPTADRDTAQFGIDVFIKYYPRAVKYVAVVDQPWIVRIVLNAILSFLSEDLRSLAKFINRDQLIDYVSEEMIPIQLNGLYDKDLVVVPRGVKPFAELCHKWFDSQPIDQMIVAMNDLNNYLKRN